ncbi:MAG: type II toxin-antitoxin system HicA family toxin [Chloroflexi bacterium]|nr:type II toxin-antitoxin system HicA family toxin [Chloroflexota bacterium]
MPKQLPVLKAKQVIDALLRSGFSISRQTGSHVILYKQGFNRPITVPIHRSDLPQGTLRAIIRQSGLTIGEFIKLL